MQNEQECNCHKLFDYVSDILSETEKSDFELHMNSCPDCKKDFLILKNIMGAVSAIPEIEVPDSLRNSVSEALKNTGRIGSIKNRFNIRQIVKFAAPVAACAAVAIGFFSGGVYDSFSASNPEISSGLTEQAPVASENPTDTAQKVIVDENKPIQSEKPYKQSPKSSEKPIGEDSATTPFSEKIPTETDSGAIVALEIQENSGQIPEVANGEIESSVYARRTVKIPSSCVIKADKAEEFIASINIEIIDNTERGFKIKVEDWDSFESYIAEFGAEYEVEYSDDIVYNIDIEIKNSQTLDKEDIE